GAVGGRPPDQLVPGGHRLGERARRFGGAGGGPSPTGRGEKGSKHPLMGGGNGTPLAARGSPATTPDGPRPPPAVAASPLGGQGPAERLPRRLYGDRAYSSAGHEGILRWMGIEPVFARRGSPHGSGLGRYRYVVERTLANVHQNRRLRVRYERRDDIHQAFLTLACIKLCWYRLHPNPK